MKTNVYMINAKKGPEKQSNSRLGHKSTDDSSILGFYSLHNQEERTSIKTSLSNQHNPNGKCSGLIRLCEKR
jgi:hypothetical protein